jgi:predicted dehydrogenase
VSARTLRWAVIGANAVSASFSRALASVPGNQRQAIISSELGSAQGFAARHGFSFALALDESVFHRKDVDVFYIATPTADHMDLCLRAIAAGKPVLCEKPMTISVEQLLAVQRAAREAQVFAMEGMWTRFNPIIGQLRARLDCGECGEIMAVSMQVGYVRAAENRTNIDPSCDALSDFGCYGFSLALHLFGRPQRILASGRTRRNSGAVEHAHLILAYAGFSFLLETSIVADTRNSLEVLGSRGRLGIPASVIDPYRLESGGWDGASGSKLRGRMERLGHAVVDQFATLHPLRGSGFRGEVAELARCLDEGRLESEVNPLSETLSCHEIEQAARTSLRTGQWQPLEQGAAGT